MLQIQEPPIFYCESDEDEFFRWLKGIPAIRDVIGTHEGLQLEIDEPIDRLSFYELVGLMTRYGLDRKCLRPLCDAAIDPLFMDSKNYWFKSVFSV